MTYEIHQNLHSLELMSVRLSEQENFHSVDIDHDRQFQLILSS